MSGVVDSERWLSGIPTNGPGLKARTNMMLVRRMVMVMMVRMVMVKMVMMVVMIVLVLMLVKIIQLLAPSGALVVIMG